MKTLTLVITIILVSLGTCFAVLLINFQPGSTNVAVQESRDTYTLAASFDHRQTATVKRFIDSCLEANGQLPVKEQAAVHYTLTNGGLKVEAQKEKNTAEAMTRIKRMYQDIRYQIIPR